jgi:Na+/H+ antiporter NhaD/arsenite permease-like protein
MIPIIILAVVFILIAVRQIGNVRLQIWQIMLGGALAVLVAGQISPINAFQSINFDVILFLLGMFVVGQALEESGYLSYLSYKIFKKAKTMDHLILLVIFVMGFAAAFLMNDTLAIIGTPVVLFLSRQHKISPKLLLLTLAFAVTIGSVMSPIGNPQNLLIAINGNIKDPFITFFEYLLIPTIINLFVAFLLLKLFYKNEFRNSVLNHSQEPIKDPKLARLSKISLFLVIFLIFAKIITVFLNLNLDFRLTYIALAAALPVLLFSPKRFRIVKKMDWHTLVFFAAMFILMQSVWNTGFFQQFVNGININSIPMILLVSVSFSQLISNVPLVALYLPILQHLGASAKEMIALAAGSTIAGNMLILGAASNVIIIQNAEKKGETLSFFEFAKIGIPLTILNILIYWIFLVII